MNINTEIFINQRPQMLLAFANYIDTIGKSSVSVKENFLQIEKES